MVAQKTPQQRRPSKRMNTYDGVVVAATAAIHKPLHYVEAHVIMHLPPTLRRRRDGHQRCVSGVEVDLFARASLPPPK
jgi:hypothetical protein